MCFVRLLSCGRWRCLIGLKSYTSQTLLSLQAGSGLNRGVSWSKQVRAHTHHRVATLLILAQGRDPDPFRILSQEQLVPEVDFIHSNSTRHDTKRHSERLTEI